MGGESRLHALRSERNLAIRRILYFVWIEQLPRGVVRIGIVARVEDVVDQPELLGDETVEPEVADVIASSIARFIVCSRTTLPISAK